MCPKLDKVLALFRNVAHFFESLNPLEEFDDNPNDFQTKLYNRSLEIEPKDIARVPYFPPSRELSHLKSPGIKHLKQAHMKQKTDRPAPLFTPLDRYGKEKSHIHSATGTAPASPTSSKDFSLVEIGHGQPPKLIHDVQSPFREVFTPSSASTLVGPATLPRPRTSSNPASIVGNGAAPGGGGPPLPPRHTTLGRASKQSFESTVSPPAVLPPKPRDSIRPDPAKSLSPRSPLLAVDAATASTSLNADNASAFRFPDANHSLPAESPSTSSLPTASTSSFQIQQQQQRSAPSTMPRPDIPPRRQQNQMPLPRSVAGGGSVSSLTPLLSADFNALNSPTINDFPSSATNGGGGVNAAPWVVSVAPPLPPRGFVTSPPPLPPRRSMSVQSPPPLPPKTYKIFKRHPDDEV